MDISVVNLSEVEQASTGAKPEMSTHKVSHLLKDNLSDGESVLRLKVVFCVWNNRKTLVHANFSSISRHVPVRQVF